MGLRRVKKYFIAHMIARVVFLFSATIMCVGMILDVIMVVNILLPYMRVVYFQPAVCTTRTTVVANVDGCNSCPRRNTTTKPCIQIYVDYDFVENDQNVTANVTLLRMNEYNILDPDVCSYKTSCQNYYWQNAAAVESYRRDYGVPGQNFTCFYDPSNTARVIVRKEHSNSAVMHSLLWPSLAIVIGLILVVIFYCWVGCDIWGSRIATVMWDKSLKRIEMEQEIRRRTNNNFNRKSLNHMK